MLTTIVVIKVFLNLVDVHDTNPYACTDPHTVKGSRVCKPCTVLAVRKYACDSMIKGYWRQPALHGS